jgi:hypothetical protein
VDSGAVVLDLIRPIVTVARLVGQKWDEPKLDAPAFARLVFEAATPAGQNSLLPGDVDCLPDGGWRCEFPSNVPATVMPLKLAVVVEQWGLVFDEPEPDAQSLILRRVAGSGGFFGGKKYGYEVTLHLPARPGDEVALVGRVFGTPDSKLAREAPDAIPKILAEMRSLLSNGQPRRKQPRVPFDRPITLYPIRSDSRVDEPLRARCRDVSPVGIGLFTAVKLRSKYLYAAFDDLPATAGHAVLLQLARTKHDGDQHFYGTLYRTDV